MKNLKYYLALMAILSVGFGLFWIFNFNRTVQIGITLSLGIAYVIWGTLCQLLKKEFHWRILWEYIIVAAVASILAIFLLLRT